MAKPRFRKSGKQLPRKYIRDLALSMMGQLSIAYVGECDAPAGIGRRLYRDHRFQMWDAMKRFSPQTLGRIAGFGIKWGTPDNASHTSLADVHDLGNWLDRYASGKCLLLQIAATTVIAEMADVIWERHLTSSAFVNPDITRAAALSVRRALAAA